MGQNHDINFDGLDEEQRAAVAAALEKVESDRQAERARATKIMQRRAAVEALRECAGSGSADNTIVVYVARMNTDLTEGKGGYRDEGYFLFREDAEDAAYALDGVGGSSNSAPVGEVVVHLDLRGWIDPLTGTVPQRWLHPQRAATVRAKIEKRAAEEHG